MGFIVCRLHVTIYHKIGSTIWKLVVKLMEMETACLSSNTQILLLYVFA